MWFRAGWVWRDEPIRYRYPWDYGFEWDYHRPQLVFGKALGFDYLRSGDTWSVHIPCSAVTIALLAPPLVWSLATGLRWLCRRRRVRRGLCVACGYDLRASGGRCPECGAVPKEAVAAGRTGNGVPDAAVR
jgi:hypothetical protein